MSVPPPVGRWPRDPIELRKVAEAALYRLAYYEHEMTRLRKHNNELLQLVDYQEKAIRAAQAVEDKWWFKYMSTVCPSCRAEEEENEGCIGDDLNDQMASPMREPPVGSES